MEQSVGILEVYGLACAFLAADAGTKAASVTLEDFDRNKPANAESLPVPLLMTVKFRGTISDVRAAMEAAKDLAKVLTGVVQSHTIPAPSDGAAKMLKISGFDKGVPDNIKTEIKTVKAYGFFEVTGVTAAIDAVDIMCKTASVSLVTWERKLGGRLVTVITEGDISAVSQAIEAAKNNCIKKPCVAAVLSNPDKEIVRLVEKSAAKYRLASKSSEPAVSQEKKKANKGNSKRR